MNRRKKQITTYFILFSFLLIGIVYAILQANLQINGTAKITQNTWDVHFDNIVVNQNSVSIGTGNIAATIDPNNDCKVDFSVTLSLPGDFYEFTVDVVNTGTIDVMIETLTKSLKVNNVVVETVPEYLNYSVTYEDDSEILDNNFLAKNTSETYKVRVEYRSDIDELPEATTLSMSVEPVYIQADSGTIALNRSLIHKISKDAVIDNINSTYVQNVTPGIDFYKIASDTNGKGVYIRSDTANDDNPIYYYRGAVENNNVFFGGFCWKIIRTTDTGGIKMIYNGTQIDNSCGTGATSQSNSFIERGNINGLDDKSKYVGYTYIENQEEKNSQAKNEIDKWYRDNLLEHFDSYLEDTVFCNDMSEHYYSEFTDEEQNDYIILSNTTIYGPKYRLLKKLTPILTCPNNSDAYTKSNSIGNGKLTYPVALITSDEAVIAGATDYYSCKKEGNCNNQIFYLQNNDIMWTMSPSEWYAEQQAIEQTVSNNGITTNNVNCYMCNTLHEYRPVISLKPGTQVSGGDGTGENPYTIE